VNRNFLLAGLAIATAMVAALLYLNRGAHLELEGAIQKVRVHPLDENSSLLIADFRVHNPSDLPFVVRSVDVFVDRAANATAIEGTTVPEQDTRRILEVMPELGPRYNPGLIARNQVGSKETTDRMVAARFEAPASELTARQNVRIRITEIDGATSEIKEKKD
jgi:hypothetical protein